jgi:hypothetical protein
MTASRQHWLDDLGELIPRWWHRPRHRHPRYVELQVKMLYRGHSRIIERRILIPNGDTIMNPVTLSIGHAAALSLVYLDQNGNPMQAPQTPDAPPTWADDTPATGTLVVGPGGLTATETAVAAGNDNVSVSLAVGGVQFKASLGIVVSPAPQILTSVEIAASVS